MPERRTFGRVERSALLAVAFLAVLALLVIIQRG
jgi:hypothetical protein